MWAGLHSENRCTLESGKEKPKFLWARVLLVTERVSYSIGYEKCWMSLSCSELALTADSRVYPANLVSAMEQILNQCRPLSRDRGVDEGTVQADPVYQPTSLGETHFFLFLTRLRNGKWKSTVRALTDTPYSKGILAGTGYMPALQSQDSTTSMDTVVNILLTLDTDCNNTPYIYARLETRCTPYSVVKSGTSESDNRLVGSYPTEPFRQLNRGRKKEP